jgi:nucleotide-binding universal stress UspA family protein
VVGVDDSLGARTALRWAIAQAATTGATIEAVHAYPFEVSWIDQTSEHVPLWRARVSKEAQRELDDVVDGVAGDSSKVAIERLVREGRAAAVLIDEAKEADLLVVGSRGRGEFAGILLGSVSQRCAERAQCPVVVVPTDPVDLQ